MQRNSWGPVEPLLLAVGSGPDQLKATIEEVGADNAVEVAVEELRERCDPVPIDDAVRFQLEVESDHKTIGWVLEVSSAGLIAEPGWASEQLPRIQFDAVEFLQSLYLPGRRAHHTRAVSWGDTWLDDLAPDPNAPWPPVPWQKRALAAHTLVSACQAGPPDLGELSVRYGSDKWSMFHWYTQHYERHFAPFRSEPIRMLEIGIGGYQNTGNGGGSLHMWQRYFPRGLIYGLDIFEKPHVRGPRIRAIQGDQNDPDFLGELGRSLGPFDIVVDDGSHVNEHVRTSLHSLLPHVRSGGLYVVEDLQTAYWPGYGGDDKNMINTDTSIGLMKALVDGLNHREIAGRSSDEASYTDQHIVGLHFYHSLAILEKGVNTEDGSPSFIPRHYSGGPMAIDESASNGGSGA